MTVAEVVAASALFIGGQVQYWLNGVSGSTHRYGGGRRNADHGRLGQGRITLPEYSFIEIGLADGRLALVSEEDYAALSTVHWHASNGYAISGAVFISMHREVMRLHGIAVPRGMEIDHINRNRLDNRFENLRVCSSVTKPC